MFVNGVFKQSVYNMFTACLDVCSNLNGTLNQLAAFRAPQQVDFRALFLNEGSYETFINQNPRRSYGSSHAR